MLTIEQLIDKLNKFPKDAKCFAYEGEDIGLTIEITNEKTGKKQFDFIRCTPKNIAD